MSAADLVSQVAGSLGAEGAVGRRWPRFEDRAQQRELALAIARTIESGGLLLAEAPTGVGKSLAYLLPAAFHASRERRVMIATCTRSLQDQLFERDLPALRAALDLPLPAVTVKGKQNYVCTRALEAAEGRDAAEQETLDRLRSWAASDPSGDLDRFPGGGGEAFRKLRGRIATDPAACNAATCRRARDCAWVRARREASNVPLVIVNHALLSLSGEIEGLLPEFDVLIVDEGHRLEGVLLSQLEVTASAGRFDEVLRTLASGGRRGTRGGLLARVRGWRTGGFAGSEAIEAVERTMEQVLEMREAVDAFFAMLEPAATAARLPREERRTAYSERTRYRNRAELLGHELDELEAVLTQGVLLARRVSALGAELAAESDAAAKELGAECENLAMRLLGLTTELDHLTDGEPRDWVFWKSHSGTRAVELHGAPVTVGGHARERVLGRARAAIVTSATLSTGGDFGFLGERLGLGAEHGAPFETIAVSSPFPLAKQMQVLVAPASADEETGVADVVAALQRKAPRNTLVLLTAHERLRRVRARLLAAGVPAVLAQEWDGPLTTLTERFRAARGAVLLGVQSLWEGVDFPGESLEILVVARLPFAVPDDPIVEARGERLMERGRDPFRHDALPEAVLRFRQGIGRLIRRADDRGVLVVCDPRLARASYRRAFLDALPVVPSVMPDVQSLAEEAARFLAPVPVEEP